MYPEKPKDTIVEGYCSYDFNPINNYLRGTNNLKWRYSANEIKHFANMASDLLNVLHSAPQIPENIVLYRFVCEEFIDTLLRNKMDGTDTTEKGFISTSLLGYKKNNRRIMTGLLFLLKIYVDKGAIGAYVAMIAGREFEQKMLLAPNGIFRLLKKPYKVENRIVNDVIRRECVEYETIIYECKLTYNGSSQIIA